jgi:predicted  nucleic acid-binding Zn-ribbon protein
MAVEISRSLEEIDNKVKSLNKTLKVSAEETKELDKALKLDGKNTEAVAQKMQALQTAVGTATQKVALLKQKQDEAYKAFQKGDMTAAEYKKIEISVQRAENELKGLNNEIVKTQKASVAQVTADFDKLSAKLGKVKAAADKVARAAAAILASLAAAALAFVKIGDELDDTSRKFGISAEQLQIQRNLYSKTTDVTNTLLQHRKPGYSSDDGWYKLVLIKSIAKSEIDLKTGVLVCDIKFTALSRWKKDQIMTLELELFGAPLTYPYYYPYIYGGRNNMAVEIDNPGLPTSCTVKIEAESDAPQFRILKDGKVIDQARYNVYVRSGSYAVIDSAADKQEASLYTKTDGGGEFREDIYYLGERDYAYSNFITIPEGRSLFLFSAINTQFGKVTVQYSLQRELI